MRSDSDIGASGSELPGFQPLTPLSFLDRAEYVYPQRLAVVDGDRRFTYAELADRSRRMATGIQSMAGGAPVAILAPNTHAMIEAHYGVPLAGSAIVPLNTRLNGSELAFILDHAEVGVLLVDESLTDLATDTLGRTGLQIELIRIGGPQDGYEALLRDSARSEAEIADELSVFSVNYTSGTTGNPKGVIFSHRGVYLQSLSMYAHSKLDASTRMLWTLPMFHCHGWAFVYAVTACGGTHICLRRFDADEAWRLIRREMISHLNGAPTVLGSLAAAPEAHALDGRRLRVGTGGAPPSPALLERLAGLGMDVTHLYGLTETLGPSVINELQPEWLDAEPDELARLHARQGIPTIISRPPRVLDDNGNDVPADGVAQGEVVFRGNNVMRGYLKNSEATRQALTAGWFRSGDIGVLHSDHYLELKDRSKDVIISGGENISSIEVEQAIASHPSVLEVAVIAVPDEKWGEVPAAYVCVRDGFAPTEASIIDHVRQRLAHFKAPKRVIFGELPKTSTGKIQKFLLRESEWSGYEHRIF